MATKHRTAGRRQIAYEVRERSVRLLEAIAAKLTLPGAVRRVSKTEALELAIERLAKQLRLQVGDKS